MLFYIKSFVLILLLGPVTASFALPAQIAIFPHAEKEANGPHLSAQGMKDAKALQNFILTAENLKPDVVIANSTPAQRALGSIETCGLISQALKIDLHSNFLESQYAKMIQTVLTNPKYTGRKVLICWDKHDIQAMSDLIEAKQKPSVSRLNPPGYSLGYLFKW